MIGIIHQVLFRVIERARGPDAVRLVRARAGVVNDTLYRINEHYPDEEFLRLVEATCIVLEITQQRAEHQLASEFLRFALERFPRFFEMCRSGRELLELQPVIHNSLATGLADPAARHEVRDKFHIDSHADRLVVNYRSANKLAGLYIALAHLVLRHYGDLATVSLTPGGSNEDGEYEIVIQWFEEPNSG